MEVYEILEKAKKPEWYITFKATYDEEKKEFNWVFHNMGGDQSGVIKLSERESFPNINIGHYDVDDLNTRVIKIFGNFRREVFGKINIEVKTQEQKAEKIEEMIIGIDEKLDKIKSKVEYLQKTKKSQNEITHAIAFGLMNTYFFKTVESLARVNPIYIYDGGVYVDEGRKLIKEKSEDILGSFAKTNIINEIINKIERRSYVNKNIICDGHYDLLCLENGIYDLQTNKLLSHSPDRIMMSKLPVLYKADVVNNIFLSFLSDTLDGDDDINTIQEWFGYMLRKVCHEKKALVCIGPTNTGKSVLLNIMSNLIGKRNTSAVTLHEMTQDTHALDALYNKYVNINDELTSKDLNEVDRFKKLTGRSTIDMNPKFKERTTFESFAKLVFATNKMPCLSGTLEDPESYYNRWIIIKFDNIIEEIKQDKHLIDKLTTPEGLSGILNWALEGLQRLLKNNRFTYAVDWQDIERTMKESGESVFSFESECCFRNDGNLVDKDEMYDRYVEYCKLNNKTVLTTKEAFGKKFRPNYVVNKNSGPKEYVGWLNVEIKRLLPILGI